MNQRFKDIMPPLTEEEFRQLEQNILADGIRDPLVVWGDVLVDGHNRYAIAQKHGLKFVVRNHDFANEEAVVTWIIQNQQGRRNLNDAQKIKYALKAEPMLAEMARERMEAGKADPKPNLAQGQTRDAVAKMAGVGHSNVEKVKHVMKHGSDDVNKKMESGELSINKAYELVKGKTKPKPRLQSTTDPITEKTCSICGITLPADRFYQSGGRLSGACKQCETAKKSFGISPTIREDIGAIQAATDYLNDKERVIEYSIEDVIDTVSAGFDQLIRITETEVTNHIDLLKNPANKDALLKALEHGVSQIQTTIKNLAR